MSEIDSLSASGTYPALALAAKRRRDAKEQRTPSSAQPPAPQNPSKPASTDGEAKHLIDEYA